MTPRGRPGGAAGGSAVEEDLLGEGGLARVGVADDGERAPALGLLDDVTQRGLALWSLPEDAAQRAGALMRKYANLPMDLADASLVLLAEHLGHGRILSTDMRDFGAYRWKNRKPFKNLLETLR